MQLERDVFGALHTRSIGAFKPVPLCLPESGGQRWAQGDPVSVP